MGPQFSPCCLARISVSSSAGAHCPADLVGWEVLPGAGEPQVALSRCGEACRLVGWADELRETVSDPR